MDGVRRVKRQPHVIGGPAESRRPVRSPDGSLQFLTISKRTSLDISVLRDEIQDMIDVLLGRKPSPIDRGVHSLQEVATVYFARCSEIATDIYQAEVDGRVLRGSALYRFRTSELRVMLDLCKRMAELGSRRLTYEQLLIEGEQTGFGA